MTASKNTHDKDQPRYSSYSLACGCRRRTLGSLHRSVNDESGELSGCANGEICLVESRMRDFLLTIIP